MGVTTEGARVCAMSLRWVDDAGVPDIEIQAKVFAIQGLKMVELPDHEQGPLRSTRLCGGVHG